MSQEDSAFILARKAAPSGAASSHIIPQEELSPKQILVDFPAEGRKDDEGKLPWHLAPWDAFTAIVCILRFGAKKYEPRNWEKGMAYSRLFRAAIGHLVDWWDTDQPDPETGHSHLWHAGCCVLFLIAYELRGVGTDDRPKD